MLIGNVANEHFLCFYDTYFVEYLSDKHVVPFIVSVSGFTWNDYELKQEIYLSYAT